MAMLPIEKPVFDDGLTEQSHKDVCDINKIVARHARAGTLSHLAEYGGQYGDFAGFDFTAAQNAIARAKSIFHTLPAEIRKEFNGSPDQFFTYVNDPNNSGRLKELLPSLAKPGRQMPVPDRGSSSERNAQSRGAAANEPAAEPPPAADDSDSGTNSET